VEEEKLHSRPAPAPSLPVAAGELP
jgi:hypothetical protein